MPREPEVSQITVPVRMPLPTGKDLLAYLHRSASHPRTECPGCGGDCGRIGIVYLVYTHVICSCGVPEYDHLIEQLWHRDCFIPEPTTEAAAPTPEAEEGRDHDDE